MFNMEAHTMKKGAKSLFVWLKYVLKDSLLLGAQKFLGPQIAKEARNVNHIGLSPHRRKSIPVFYPED